MCNSNNQHVQLITNIARTDARSIINQNIQTIASVWRVNVDDLLNCMSINRPSHIEKLTDHQKHSLLCILEIDEARNGIIEIPGFNNSEMQDIYEYAATN